VLPAAGERGKKMFQLLVSRQAQHAIDLDARSLVEERKHLMYRPAERDEDQHDLSQSGILANESWYFDAVTPDAKTGVYARIGRLPNQDACTFMASIFREGHSPILLMDMQGPLPSNVYPSQTFSNDRIEYTQTCEEPLQKWHVQLSGTGKTFDEAAASLRGESGHDVPNVSFDLTWETAQRPFKKPGQTRYEIPCTVNGSLQVDGQSYQLSNAPGNRNHSWVSFQRALSACSPSAQGVRDWWQVDWVWSAFHFEDGTRMFTIALHKGDESAHPAGYIQKDGRITEVTKVANYFDWGADGLVAEMRTVVEPGNLDYIVRTKAGGGILLVSPDGRETQLPRSLGTVESADGKQKGVCWVDWNHVIRKEAAGEKRQAADLVKGVEGPAKRKRAA
jgi:hypothetical protein